MKLTAVLLWLEWYMHASNCRTAAAVYVTNHTLAKHIFLSLLDPSRLLTWVIGFKLLLPVTGTSCQGPASTSRI